MKGLDRSLSRGPHPIRQHVTRHTIKVENLEVTVHATTTAVGFGTVVAGELPEGNILLIGALGYLKFDGSGSDDNLTADWEGNFSVGTTGTADVTLDGTDVDLLPDTDLAAADAEIGVRTRAQNAVQAFLDNTDGSMEINISALIDAADITDDQDVILTINGEIELVYMVILDD